MERRRPRVRRAIFSRTELDPISTAAKVGMRQGQQFTCEKATGHPAPGGCAINHFPVTPGEGALRPGSGTSEDCGRSFEQDIRQERAIKLRRPLDDPFLLVIVPEGVPPFPQLEPIESACATARQPRGDISLP